MPSHPTASNLQHNVEIEAFWCAIDGGIPAGNDTKSGPPTAAGAVYPPPPCRCTPLCAAPTT